MIENSLKTVKDKISEVCRNKGIDPASITIIGVTKNVTAGSIDEAISLGLKNVGENKVQEAEKKFPAISGISAVKTHFIGHLQTNKAKKAVELFDLIQSVDSIRLVKELNTQAANINKVQDCLIEVKISGEESKFGLKPEEIEGFLKEAEGLNNIKFHGIMGMAPFFDDPVNAKPYFMDLKEIFDNLAKKHEGFNILSMGMSGDFQAAIEEGSTMVRIGTAIFGERGKL